MTSRPAIVENRNAATDSAPKPATSMAVDSRTYENQTVIVPTVVAVSTNDVPPGATASQFQAKK